MSDLTNDLVTQIRDTAAAGGRLTIEGGASKRWYGNPVQNGAVLRTTGHTGIVDYDPAELVLTARAGTPLAELEQVLADRGQMLAFEPPRHSVNGVSGATLGGAVATALSGPGRAFAGGVRDFVLGLHVIDGKGDVLKFGGQVMKNVAGYDVSRLMTGSLGVLGLISQVSLKVLPVPPATATLRFEMDAARANDQINAWSGRPLPLSATAWQAGVLHVRLSGARAAVDSAIQQLGGVRFNEVDAASLWTSLRDQSAAFFSQGSATAVLWRLSLPQTARVVTAQDIQGADDQLIEWGGAQRWVWSDDAAEKVRDLARSLGGHAVCFDNRQAQRIGLLEVFDRPSAALMAVHQRLKQTFDPQGVFNPGRLYRDM
jgi:glycolate oxidase FAD binding subunit